jgi:pimeloyl-ACP methyl ester carboxylesterase
LQEGEVRRARGLALLIALLAIPLGCGRQTPLSPRLSNQESMGAMPRSAESLKRRTAGAQHIEGRIGPGSSYVIDVPENWNGELVVYAHGYVPTFLPVGSPVEGAELRQALLQEGYALIGSSFSENGYAEADGARRTHQLRGVFASRVGQPERTFIVGVSLGALIALELVEEHPRDYAGAFLISGVVGGTKLQIDYVTTIRVLFDKFYPGIVPGSPVEVPADVNPAAVVQAAYGAMVADPQGLGAMDLIDQARIPHAPGDFPHLLESVLRVLAFDLVAINDFVARTHGHSFFDNSDVVYASGALPPPLVDNVNATVARLSSTPDAQNFIRNNYQPNGQLEVPVLTLHTRFDPVVPELHEGAYHDIVAAAGRLDFLAQRRKEAYGHFGDPVVPEPLDQADVLNGFHDLVTWVDTGVKPAP